MSEDIRDPRAFRWVESGVSGLARPQEWDLVTTTICPVAGTECGFVLATGTHAIVEFGLHEATSCGVRALDGLIEPAYRAVMVRRESDTWSVGAVSIQVAELADEVGGDEATLVVAEDGSRSLTVDGRPTVEGIDALERLADARFPSYVTRVRRLDPAFFEVTVEPL